MNLKNKTLNQIKLYYVYKLTKNGLGSRDTMKQKNIEILKNKIYISDMGMKRKYNKVHNL